MTAVGLRAGTSQVLIQFNSPLPTLLGGVIVTAAVLAGALGSEPAAPELLQPELENTLPLCGSGPRWEL